MDGDELQPPLCHHVPRHRAVDAAGKEQGRFAPRPHRDSPGPGQLALVEVGVLLSDLHRHQDVGVLHIHLQVGEPGQEQPPQLPADLRGLHGEGFVASLGLHLKGPGRRKVRRQIIRGGGTDGPPVLGDHQGRAEGHDAKDGLEPLHRLLHPDLLGEGLHVDGGLALPDVELPQGLQPPPGVFDHGVLKGVAVLALQDQLPAL